MKKNIFIVHGSKGDIKSHWFQWLKNELENNNFNVILEQFPAPPDGQNLENWLEVINKFDDKINEETIFVGHSIATPFFLNFLERTYKKIKSCYTIASFLEIFSGDNEYDKINSTFMKKDFNFEKIKNNCDNFYVFHSKDDPYVPIENGIEFAEKVGGKFFEYENAGHFNSEAGYDKFEDLLKLILENEKKD